LAVLALLLAALGVVLYLLLRSSGSPASFTVPNVALQPVGTATQTLQNDGLKVATQDVPSAFGVGPGSVLDQTPKPPAKVSKGDTDRLQWTGPGDGARRGGRGPGHGGEPPGQRRPDPRERRQPAVGHGAQWQRHHHQPLPGEQGEPGIDGQPGGVQRPAPTSGPGAQRRGPAAEPGPLDADLGRVRGVGPVPARVRS